MKHFERSLLAAVLLGVVCGTTNQLNAQTPADGTVIYCRRNPANNQTTIWFAGLQGGADTLITTGWMARISLDRRFLVFLRDGTHGSAYTSQGDLWVRDLTSGTETNLYHDTDFIVAGDFTRDASTVIFDFACSDYSISRDGSANGTSTFLSGGNCYDDAPAVNPIDGQLPTTTTRRAEASASLRRIFRTKRACLTPRWAPTLCGLTTANGSLTRSPQTILVTLAITCTRFGPTAPV
jgi:hypothetical protein